MKKYNLLKVIGIVALVAWLLTFFVPGSQMDYSGKIVKGEVAPVGLWTLVSNTSISISYFNSIAVFLIAIAIFYGVLSKLDVYNNFVSKTADKFSKKPNALIIVSVLFFGILSTLVSDALLLLVFVPFVYQVMKKLEIDSKVILSSTIIAGFIGSISRLYDSSLFKAFSIGVNTLLLVKIIVLVLNLFALIILITPKKNKEATRVVKKETRPVASKKETPKKSVAKATNSRPVKKSQPKKKTSGRGRS